jgi:hypothetical protein
VALLAGIPGGNKICAYIIRVPTVQLIGRLNMAPVSWQRAFARYIVDLLLNIQGVLLFFTVQESCMHCTG